MREANKPLAHKSIVVTRAIEQTAEFADALERIGAEVLRMPTVGFAAPPDWDPVDASLKDLSRFAWVLFTSQNAVRFFAGRAKEIGAGAELFRGESLPGMARIAAIGDATAEAAAAQGVRVDFIAKQKTGDGLAREVRAFIGVGEALLPRSDRAGDRLPGALRETGARVTEVVAYRTAMPALDEDLLDRVRRAQVHAIIFASPSAFQNLDQAMPAGELALLSTHVHFAAIGPTTARALRDAGARVEIQANEPSAAGIADALAKYYQRQPAAARHA